MFRVMKLNEFIKNFASEFEETADNLFTATTIYKDLEEWNSLTALSIIAMVDDIYEKTITGADLRGCNTIEDLFKVVSNK